MTSRQLQFYITVESPCSYYDDRVSRNLVPDPDLAMNMPVYSQLIQHGFRRSGSYCYRPYCKHCQSCVASRIPVKAFRPNRSQRRCNNRNNDLSMSTSRARFTEEHFALYAKYLDSRHEDSSMASPREDDFRDFLFCDWSDTRYIELRQGDHLVAVAVTDFVRDGLSAVYSFFDPGMQERGLGTYCILQQIAMAKQLRLPYVYLGYWLQDHPKMHYKINYRPLELYLHDCWQRFDKALPSEP
jgi:arginine-tRNA-protein transferase